MSDGPSAPLLQRTLAGLDPPLRRLDPPVVIGEPWETSRRTGYSAGACHGARQGETRWRGMTIISYVPYATVTTQIFHGYDEIARPLERRGFSF